jgi:hypothetical protein
VAALLAGCVSSEAVPRRDRPGDTRIEATTAPAVPATSQGGTEPTGTPPSPGPQPVEPPAPEEEIPARGAALARALEETVAAGRGAIETWLADGDPGSWPPPQDVELWVLYEQRIYRHLAAHAVLAERVLDRLGGRAVREARANVAAGHALYEHFSPVHEVPDFRIRRPEPADALRSYFVQAEERFDVGWEVLAAIMLVETRMGRIRSRSSAGAQGPMQFLPATWEAYGLGGDVHDPHDAVLGAANYLRASGAPGNYRAALHAYNPVDAYVTAVWRYAVTMRRYPDAYYAYYNWQVFVRTVHGDVRLSGPGR